MKNFIPNVKENIHKKHHRMFCTKSTSNQYNIQCKQIHNNNSNP